jgi:hypothetical protein
MKRYITRPIMLTLLITFTAGASVQASPSLQPESPAAMCNNLDLKNGPLASAGYDLAALYCEYIGEPVTPNAPVGSSLQRVPLAHTVNSPAGTLVVIDAVASGDTAALKADLEALGLQNASAFGPMVSGLLPVSAVADMAALPSLRFARASAMTTSAGLVTSQGDNAMKANTVRTAVGVDGTGITVGTLSDSYDCLSPGSATTDVTNGDLPAGVNVLQEMSPCTGGTDEGRGMMQLIHDVAPGSSQAFHSAFNGMADFANGIVELARDANCDVIVDDVIYYTEPMFQDGIIAQAVATATSVYEASYFSSSGNQARQSYEANYSEGTDPLSGALAHDFDTTAGTDYYQQLTLPASSQVTIIFQWAQPYASATGGSGATTDLNICFDNNPPTGTFAIGCTSTNNVGGDPIEGVTLTNSGGSPLTFNFSVVRAGGAAFSGRIKYVYYRRAGSMMTVNQYATNSGTCYGHANAATAEAVGAAGYYNTPVYGVTPPLLESFSSAGPTTIYYDLNDNPVAQTRPKPGVTAPDGTDTTFFGSSDYEPDGWLNFWGTSAAAPHAAAVAGLLLDYDGSLSPTQQYALMEATAIDMSTAGFDYDTGWGLIQADFIGADFSDLAASYGYAYHAYTTTNTLRLGSLWTGDTTFAAGHDDASDDGVVRTAAVNWTPGGSGSVDVTVAGCGGTCRLNAWVDWNNDGDFADAGEKILTDQAVTNGSISAITFAVPASPACYPGTCNARFRLSTASGTGITGSAADGEVEDYAWNFGPNAISVSSASVNSEPDAALPDIVIGLFILVGLATTGWFFRKRRAA